MSDGQAPVHADASSSVSNRQSRSTSGRTSPSAPAVALNMCVGDDGEVQVFAEAVVTPRRSTEPRSLERTPTMPWVKLRNTKVGSWSSDEDGEGIVGISPRSEAPPTTMPVEGLPLHLAIAGQLTICNEAVTVLVMRPTMLTRLEGLHAATKRNLKADPMGGVVDTRLGLGPPCLRTLVFNALKVCLLGTRTRRISALLVATVVAGAIRMIVRRLGVKLGLLAVTLSCAVPAGAFYVLLGAIRWVLTPRSLTDRSPFSNACRCVILLKAALTSLMEARIAASRHHLTNKTGADLIALQQQWLIRTILDDPFFTAASYRTRPTSSLTLEPQSPTRPRAEVSPEELEILVARAQHTMLTAVKYMAILVPDGSYLASVGDFGRLLIGIRQLYAHRRALGRLADRLGEGFAPSVPKPHDGDEGDAAHPSFVFQELYTHAQRLSGQLYLLRIADMSSVTEAERQQAMDDLAEAVSALAGAWNRVGLGARGQRPLGGLGGRGYAAFGGTVGDDDAIGDDRACAAPNIPAYAEMSAQGEDPIPLYPMEAFDEEVGSQRGALPDNFAELLAKMRKR